MSGKHNEDPGLMGRIMHGIKERGDVAQKDSDPAQRRVRFSIWYLIGGMLLFVWFQGYLGGQQREKVIYSVFKQWVREGKVSDLVVGAESISGTVKDENKAVMAFVTVRVEDPELVRELQEKQIEFSGYTENKWIALLVSWLLPLGIFGFIWYFMIKRMSSGPQGVLSLGKARVKIYAEKEVKVTFNDVAGIDEAKGELEEVVQFLRDPARSQRLGGRIPKGVLLAGAPGTGKTLLAKAVAGEAGVFFFSMSGSEFVEIIVGVGSGPHQGSFQTGKGARPLHYLSG